MIRQESINRMGLQEERVPFRMAMGGLAGDGKTSVMEEGAIGDEPSRGLVSACG